MSTGALGGLGRLGGATRSRHGGARRGRVRGSVRDFRARAIKDPIEGALEVSTSALDGGLESRVAASRVGAEGTSVRKRSVTRVSAIDFPMKSIESKRTLNVGNDLSWTRWKQSEGAGDPGVQHDFKRVIFITPDNGFIMGPQKTVYHLEGCPCPSCNVFRYRVRNGVDAKGHPITPVMISASEFHTLKEIGTVKDMTKVEQRRRERIGSANAGKTPWNKGRKHRKETIEKIRATTLKHMKDPEYRERLKQSYTGSNARHSEFTRAKIKRASMDRARSKKIAELTVESANVWGRKRGNNGTTSAGIFMRRSSAVMTVSFGVNGSADIARMKRCIKDEEKERQKNQRVLKKQIISSASIKLREMRKTKVKKPAKRSAEHRQKIARAIADKWRDPEYAAKMRNVNRKPPVKKSKTITKVDPAKKKLLIEIKAMYFKADAAVNALRARVAAGQPVDPDVLARATKTRKQSRSMYDAVKRSIEEESTSVPSPKPR
ncbi:unnamed product [Ostreococcus tauri]|uniref:Unnamed product n=1 Tax=Ostreococcus tauri TaxID=70448 RepID=A0A090N2S4_OSTTA|nr:unnamed product [Ostreococcus tauri]CEF96743.1 unnamed product [Ostreococcus tauri]|eukprot:XP_022838272.1 unnamed product [Ostreococcus tauri]